eukprot:CFRG3379T1
MMVKSSLCRYRWVGEDRCWSLRELLNSEECIGAIVDVDKVGGFSFTFAGLIFRLTTVVKRLDKSATRSQGNYDKGSSIQNTKEHMLLRKYNISPKP